MTRDVKEIAEGPVGQFLEPDAIRWAAILDTQYSEQDAVRLLTMMSVAVSLKRMADAQMIQADVVVSSRPAPVTPVSQ